MMASSSSLLKEKEVHGGKEGVVSRKMLNTGEGLDKAYHHGDATAGINLNARHQSHHEHTLPSEYLIRPQVLFVTG